MSDFNQQIIEEFRANGGTVTTYGFGRNLVLVHHEGARTGTRRIAPLFALPTPDGGWWIAASKAGADDDPAWFHNLQAHPDTVIEHPDHGEVAVHAVVLEGADRDEVWAKFKEASPGFAGYEQKTSRVIPVVELRRR
ncbi:deazaflavin-dependent oxidoreductase (nitroreductase family) [Kineococcus rhizosphaerae]|uniref:Deazaflavin-dependent oxidoreductase (Nitroreductase family) n=1 Tax=Kineococcus rhizosphaerae TaxID=559628 RepID=A0A2T0R258_9ACTN|nr:nitroreductase family deazaflavin-dependent oxidoreductase [Kineococcus rhizosphaerae]PRY13605.1 deazaflavin-dependent oxidoreductase (nitroreductase family) [Kineococcus rhizosphaerae]